VYAKVGGVEGELVGELDGEQLDKIDGYL